MIYSKEKWKRRIAERTDMSTSIVHLTREAEINGSVLDTLFDILSGGVIKGSSTRSGFICGKLRSVLSGCAFNILMSECVFEQNK